MKYHPHAKLKTIEPGTKGSPSGSVHISMVTHRDHQIAWEVDENALAQAISKMD